MTNLQRVIKIAMGIYLLVALTYAVIVLMVLTAPTKSFSTSHSEVVRDPESGNCYRLIWVPVTWEHPGGIVSTDGVLCPYGVK